ncbi:hypothetical protein NM952_12220 [Pasteurella multocida subsp. multocida]|uniref:hypothetical protein n=1 Tax=Pasteurella TaxID=745 RepID=UPI000C7978D1|nr:MULTISPECIES: hypothetical protein [Pasteurella]MBF6983957.1 hypothetical protein [Pasteurella multocida]MDA5609381.1 hypothetical protein [Pasteurella multocida subsp. multocida]MDA5616900.1 hypothetical protein [Pasteurella multocida]MDA5619351.1 hypothetical protein [Pasteurella multocida subsp. multocida]MDA5626936.1 hypothetical protein [Pasteurella multocida]
MINKLSRLFEKSVKIAILLLLIVFFLNVTGVLELDKVQKAFVITTLFSLWLLRIEITVDKVNEKLDRKTRISYTYTDEHGKEKTVSYLIK